MSKAALKRAIKIISQSAQDRFDACMGADGSGFVCGGCDQGNVQCEREHREMVRAANELRAMLTGRVPSTNTNKR